MTRQEFRELTEKKRVILDGATGSCLIAAGMPSGVCPEQWILENPEVLIRLQADYLQAGTDILYAPTFSANRIKLAEYGLSGRVIKMNGELIALSKEAVRRAGREGNAYVAADLTMTGKQLAPMGTMDFEELFDVYREQALCCVKAGADLFVVETMMNLKECRIALLAIREVCELPVMITLTFLEDGHTFFGNTPEACAVVLGGMGADAIGLNCSAGPDKLLSLVKRMVEVSDIPVVVKPNAGLPVLSDGRTLYDMDAQEFVGHMEAVLMAGAALVGGCCGTTPVYIKGLAKAASKFAPVKLNKLHLRALATERDILRIDLDGRFLTIGERINQTGKPALKESLLAGEMEMVEQFAREQAEDGADILDINMGMSGIDEKAMMLSAIETVSATVNLALCIDSSHPEVIEAALRRYPGRALVNSVSLEEGKMEKLFPAIKKYGAMFILLPLSQTGLPKDMEEKKQIIRTILAQAEKYGLCREDIFVDGLVNTVGANPDAALAAVETIRYCREELGLATMCGLSNISFGLPQRPYVNAAFLAFAIQAGITAAIVNPSQDLLMTIAAASDLLRAREGAELDYIRRVTEKPPATIKAEGKKAPEAKDIKHMPEHPEKPAMPKLYEAVLSGNRKGIVALAAEAVSGGKTPQELLDEELIPAINEVGELFNRREYFLPQLIASAEAMKMAVEYLEPLLKSDEGMEKQGVVVIATVSGDVHDIGKNLVALMLKNYGFDVHDLGKDVPTEEIIRSAKEFDADIIAVSALMTTTMLEMKEIVKQRDAAGLRAKIMIGGAVITQEYCDEIHADGYSKDAQEAVVVAKRLVGKTL